MRTRRGRKVGPSCVESVGEGRTGSALLSAESCGPAYLSTHPAPSPRGMSVNPSPPRWAALRASGFLRANYAPRARASRPLPAAASYAPPVPDPEGRRTREGCPDRFMPSFLDVRERSQNWLPASPTEPYYESQRAAPPRVSATGAVPSGSWSSPTAAALADRNRPRVLAAGSGTPNRPSAGPRSPPHGASNGGGREGFPAPSAGVRALDSLRSLLESVVCPSGSNLGKLSGSLSTSLFKVS